MFMDGLGDAAVIAGMFILRLGVPLAITLAVGYVLLRLDAKWQAEAWAEWESDKLEEEEQAEQAAGRATSPMAKQPCWELKGCSQAVREQCPAYKRPDVPCWLVRRRAEGRLPAACYDCELFSLKQVSQSVAS
jgi:hypothetical protein